MQKRVSYFHTNNSNCYKSPEEEIASGHDVALTRGLEGWRLVQGFAFTGCPYCQPLSQVTVQQCLADGRMLEAPLEGSLLDSSKFLSSLVLPSPLFSITQAIVLPINDANHSVLVNFCSEEA